MTNPNVCQNSKLSGISIGEYRLPLREKILIDGKFNTWEQHVYLFIISRKF